MRKLTHLVVGGGPSKFSLYISDMGLLSSKENSMLESPLLGVTPSACKMSFSEGSYSLLDISMACIGRITSALTKYLFLFRWITKLIYMDPYPI